MPRSSWGLCLVCVVLTGRNWLLACMLLVTGGAGWSPWVHVDAAPGQGQCKDKNTGTFTPMLHFCHSWMCETLFTVHLEPIVAVSAPFSADVSAALEPLQRLASSMSNTEAHGTEFSGAFCYAVRSILAPEGEVCDDNGEWAVGAADFLMKSLLMSSPAPNPLPPHLDAEKVQSDPLYVADTSYQLFGKAATMATVEDATSVLPFTCPSRVLPLGKTAK